MSMPERCDVLVIGGGPAGSVASTLLCQDGYDVVLLEKKEHPRYHVGESFIPHFWKYCDAVGVTDRILEEDFLVKCGGTVAWDGTIRQMKFSDFDYDRPALHVERDRFDAILSDHARQEGVQVHEPCAALEVETDADESRVRYRRVDTDETGEIAARCVVDASGQSGVIANQHGLRTVDDDFRFMSVWGYFRGGRYVGGDGAAHPVESVRDVPPATFVTSVEGLGDWGWSWHIPLRGTTSVGLVVPVERVRAGTERFGSPEEYFLETCRSTDYLGDLLEDATYEPGSFHGIRDYSYAASSFAGPGYYLVGDAAAFVDPIFSVGVLFALYSGRLAAWAIDGSLSRPGDAERYRSLYERQLRGRLELARTLALPRYGPPEDVSEAARTSVGFESDREKELMFVVSTLTTRSSNLLEMMGSPEDEVSSDRYRILDDLEL